MTTQFDRPLLTIAATICTALLIASCSAPQTVVEDPGEGQQVSEESGAPDNNNQPAKDKPGATLKKTGIGRDGDYGWVTSIVSNTSVENVGRFVTVQFNLMDDEGEIVLSTEQVEQFTSATQTLAIGTQVELAGKAKVAKVEATLGLSSDQSMDDLPNLTVGKIKIVDGEFGGRQATFEVKNPTDSAQKSARIGVVCFNKKDKIIGGGSNYPELIPANGRVRVEADVLTAGKPASCEAYAAPSTF